MTHLIGGAQVVGNPVLIHAVAGFIQCAARVPLPFLEFTGNDAGMNSQAAAAALSVGLIQVVGRVGSRIAIAEVVDDLVGVVQGIARLERGRLLGVVLAQGGVEFRLEQQMLAVADHGMAGVA